MGATSGQEQEPVIKVPRYPPGRRRPRACFSRGERSARRGRPGGDTVSDLASPLPAWRSPTLGVRQAEGNQSPGACRLPRLGRVPAVPGMRWREHLRCPSLNEHCCTELRGRRDLVTPLPEGPPPRPAAEGRAGASPCSWLPAGGAPQHPS